MEVIDIIDLPNMRFVRRAPHAACLERFQLRATDIVYRPLTAPLRARAPLSQARISTSYTASSRYLQLRVRQTRNCPNFLFALLVLTLMMGALVACTPEAESRPSKPKPLAEHLVELEVVTRDTMRMSTVYTGSLRARRSVRIFTQEEGTITKLPFYEGDKVAAGDLVLELDDRLLKAEIAKTVAMRRQAQINFERLARLRKQNLVSEDDYLRGETALQVARAEESVLATRLSYTRVTAPFVGVVTLRGAEPGDFVERNSHILTIVDPSSLVAELMVSELVMPHVMVDDAVTVQIDALGDQHFRGRVLRLHPELDARTRQGRIEVELKPVPKGAQTGQFARVRFQVEAFDRVVIPFAALRRDRDGEFVYSVNEELITNRVTVRSGRRFADRVEIVEGLTPGERVVTKGFLGLEAGKKVTPVGQSLDPSRAAQSDGG